MTQNGNKRQLKQHTLEAVNYTGKLPYACANIQWTERWHGTHKHVRQNGVQWKTAEEVVSFPKTIDNLCRHHHVLHTPLETMLCK